jgi:chemotaxis protein MotB
MDPRRLAVVGLGEYRPAQSNATPQGRNMNRRVLLVILSGNGLPEGDYAEQRGQALSDAAEPQTPPAVTTVEASPEPQPAPATVETQPQPVATTVRAPSAAPIPPGGK